MHEGCTYFWKGKSRQFNLFYVIYLSIYISIKYFHSEQIKPMMKCSYHIYEVILFQENKSKKKHKKNFNIKLM